MGNTLKCAEASEEIPIPRVSWVGFGYFLSRKFKCYALSGSCNLSDYAWNTVTCVFPAVSCFFLSLSLFRFHTLPEFSNSGLWYCSRELPSAKADLTAPPTKCAVSTWLSSSCFYTNYFRLLILLIHASDAYDESCKVILLFVCEM